MLKDRPAPADVVAPLILDFLQWLAAEPRAYPEVMEAWRTSCPRLTVWEDAVDAGYVARRRAAGGVAIEVTPRGLGLLAEAGRA
ncbi:MAG TPA: hypothetical protein VGN89_00655 [Phenylobacterium sp.]|nr:hypothetical protein [Phenylobacterium sp.]